MTELGPQHAQSFARGISVILAFDADHAQMTLSEVADRTGMTRAMARRFLLTLSELGYVTVNGRKFALKPKILEIGFSFLSGLTLPENAQPYLETLSRDLDESTSVSVLDEDHIVYIARVSKRRIMNLAITIGTRYPARLTAMGRVLLAAQPEHTWPADLRDVLAKVRDQGWAFVDQEHEIGFRSIAAPITGADGNVIAAINVSSSPTTATIERVHEEFLPALLDCASKISETQRVRQ
jgi:IclR family pca regulon transcriptional regulator